MWNRDVRNPAKIESTKPATQPDAVSAEARSTGVEARPMACIGKSVVIIGDVTSAEDLAIDGRVEGRIEVRNHSLTVGVGGAVRADVIARTVTIRGDVTGNVTATERVHLRETGSVEGDIIASRFAMSDGAVFCGSFDAPRAETRVRDEEARQFPVAV